MVGPLARVTVIILASLDPSCLMPEQTQHPQNLQAAFVLSFVIQVPVGRQGGWHRLWLWCIGCPFDVTFPVKSIGPKVYASQHGLGSWANKALESLSLINPVCPEAFETI